MQSITEIILYKCTVETARNRFTIGIKVLDIYILSIFAKLKPNDIILSTYIGESLRYEHTVYKLYY